MEYKDTLALDLAMQQPLRVIRAKQYDNDTRKITASFKDSRTNTPLTIPTGARAELRVERRDGVLIIIQGEISGNSVTATLSSEALACEGRAWCDFRVTKGDEVLAASGFVMDVQPLAKGRASSGYESDTINIRRLKYEDYQALPEKSPNTIYVTYDNVTGESWIFFGGFEIASSRGGIIAEQGLTREQIYALICAVIDGGTVGDVDTGFVTTLKEINNGLGFRIWLGTQAEYEDLQANDLLEAGVLYLRSDDTSAEEIRAAIAALQAAATELQAKTADSGWKALPVSVMMPGWGDGTPAPKYRKIGNHVYVKGQVNVNLDEIYDPDTGSDDITTIFIRLPEGCRPATSFYKLIPNQGDRMARLYVRSASASGDPGGMNINYLKDYSGTPIRSGTVWIQIDCDFLTD